MENEECGFDNVFATKAKPVIPVMPIRKSRGGMSDISELTEESVLRVRGEFMSATFEPKITITLKTITLNPSCIRFLSDSQHLTISIDERHRRLFVEPMVDKDNDMNFAHFKIGKNVPRACAAKLCSKLFYIMGWDTEAKYRIEAAFHGFDCEILVFRLDNAVLVLPKASLVKGGT